MRVLVLYVVAAVQLRAPVTGLLGRDRGHAVAHAGLDPYCTTGIMNGPLTACCTADCGECSENSPMCKANATNGRLTTCCPSAILAGLAKEGKASCEDSHAPCIVPEFVRTPKAQAYGKVHAKDDCNKVVRATEMANHLATAYVKFEKKSVGASEDCGTTYGTLEQMGAACSDSETCMGFSVGPADTDHPHGKPKCLYSASGKVEPTLSSSDDLYLKREDGYAGHTFRFTTPELGECSKSCGGGKQASKTGEGCESTAGVSKNLAMCTLLVAMNPDAQPEYTRPCNMHGCPGEQSYHGFLVTDGFDDRSNEAKTVCTHGPQMGLYMTSCDGMMENSWTSQNFGQTHIEKNGMFWTDFVASDKRDGVTGVTCMQWKQSSRGTTWLDFAPCEWSCPDGEDTCDEDKLMLPDTQRFAFEDGHIKTKVDDTLCLVSYSMSGPDKDMVNAGGTDGHFSPCDQYPNVKWEFLDEMPKAQKK